MLHIDNLNIEVLYSDDYPTLENFQPQPNTAYYILCGDPSYYVETKEKITALIKACIKQSVESIVPPAGLKQGKIQIHFKSTYSGLNTKVHFTQHQLDLYFIHSINPIRYFPSPVNSFFIWGQHYFFEDKTPTKFFSIKDYSLSVTGNKESEITTQDADGQGCRCDQCSKPLEYVGTKPVYLLTVSNGIFFRKRKTKTIPSTINPNMEVRFCCGECLQQWVAAQDFTYTNPVPGGS